MITGSTAVPEADALAYSCLQVYSEAPRSTTFLGVWGSPSFPTALFLPCLHTTAHILYILLWISNVFTEQAIEVAKAIAERTQAKAKAAAAKEEALNGSKKAK